MKKLVLYHAHCNDGFGAAWVAHRVFGDGADYVPVHHGDPPPRSYPGREVLVLDFAYPRDVLLEMHEKATSLLVLDHHVTAQRDLEGLDWAVFDLEHSGAVLAWKHFFPDEATPWLLEYVEDKDLWTWKLPNSERSRRRCRVIRAASTPGTSSSSAAPTPSSTRASPSCASAIA